MEFLSRFPALLTEESEMGNANILIIEDDEDIREGIRILLESEDYQITEAADGLSLIHISSCIILATGFPIQILRIFS